MTKCIITGKTYPDYKPQQHRSINSARKNMEYGLGQLDWLNVEHLNMARKLYEAIQHLHQNRGDEFKQKLHEINTTTFAGMQGKYFTESERIEDASEKAELFIQGVQRGWSYVDANYCDDVGVYVTEENGDIRYSDWAQDIFNERYDYHMAESYFEPDDVCRNGKPIADCECC